MAARKWEVTAFVGNSTEPKTIKRLRDKQVFSIGDFVTNGTKMRGHIKKFDYSFQGDEVFVITDWSGIGMNLDSLSHKPKLPSDQQIGDEVKLDFGSAGSVKKCTVVKVHFSDLKVMYDVDIAIEVEDLNHKPHIAHTRIYNVDSCFVTNG